MKKALYTLTPGRSGTVYLTALLQHNLANATVIHERTGFPHLGVNTPDASHATTFNHVGNVEPVRQFWQRKLQRDAADSAEWFVEISHHLGKAGLIENFDLLTGKREVNLVLLRRDPFKVAWSYINRFEFINNGFTWLFTLDPAYPRRIIDSTEYRKQGMFGNAIWYVNEVYARQAYYRLLLESTEGVRTHLVKLETLTTGTGAADFLGALTNRTVSPNDTKIPSPQNESGQRFFDDTVKEDAHKLLQMLWRDPDVAGAEFYHGGGRLGAPDG